MISNRQSFYSFLLYSILMILPKVLSAADKPVVPFLNYSGDLRVLNVDIETLDPKEPIIPQLFQAVKSDLKDHPKYASQNYLVLGYLSQLQESNEDAHEYFQKIPESDPLFGTMLFFDGTTLRKIGEQTTDKEKKEKNCKASMEALERVKDIAPSYFSLKQPKELTQSTFCYFEAIVQKNKMDVQQEQWFKTTLESSSATVANDRRQSVYFLYFDVLKSHGTNEELKPYLELGFKLFPNAARLSEEAQKIGLVLPTPVKPQTPQIEKTEEEAQKLYVQAKEAQEKNQIKQSLQKFSEIVSKFPESYTGERSKQDIMTLIRNEIKWNRNTTPYNDELKKLPPVMIFDIAKLLWNRDYNMTAYTLYSELIEKYPYFEKTSEAYYSVARMHEDWSEWQKAIKFYSAIVEKYSKSKFFERAHFKVGFLYYMDGKYDKAIEWLAREKTLVTDHHQKAQASYWLGRTYEKMKKKNDASAQFEEIRKKYPLTYYSFILGIDPSAIKNTPMGFQNLSIESSHPLYLPSIYLGVGLHKPARNMIQAYGNENEEHLYQIVQLFHDTGFYVFAMPNALDLSEKIVDRKGLQNELVKMIFPVKYLDVVEREAKNHSLDPLVALSLIKQESGYFERAVSSANAIGLMQLLVPTAQVIAKTNKDPLPEKDDLFEPEKNIRFGIQYLKSLNDKFNNDVTLVLSAYNAGPERAVKWKNRWPNVRKDEFVELIPFSETRKYVKLILRNYSYYKFIVQHQSPNIQEFGF